MSKSLKRHKRKNAIQLQLIKMLQAEKEILQSSQLDNIDSALHELLQNERKNKTSKTGRRYSQQIRRFAFTVYYYSPQCYRYLRSILSLPSPRTIRRWLQAVQCQPGFLIDVLDKVATEPAPLYSLVIDSMSIRQRLIDPGDSKPLLGYVDYGNGMSDNPEKQASEALVFLLVSLNSKQRHPCGYFFVDKTNAEIQKNLIIQFLTLAQEKGIDIMNITCDGCPTNQSTLQKLGAKLPDNPSFSHPVNKKVSVW